MLPLLLGPGYAAAAPEPSFSCADARGAVETLICASEDLAASERLLAERLSDLRGRLTREGFATVEATQATWLELVGNMCLSGAREAAEQTICLVDRFSERIQDLALAEATAPPLRIEGRARLALDPATATWETDSYPYAIGPRAAAEAFNAHVRRELRTDRPLAPSAGAGAPKWSAYRKRVYEIARADARILSIPIVEHGADGLGGGIQNRRTLNWNVARARPLRLDDLFGRDTRWRPALVAHARADLQRQLERDPDEEGPAEPAVTRLVDEIENWTFRGDAASLHVAPGRIAAAELGDFDVEFPLALLQPFLPPNSLLAP